MASGGSKNSITGDVSGPVVQAGKINHVTINYHAPALAPAEPRARLVHG